MADSTAWPDFSLQNLLELHKQFNHNATYRIYMYKKLGMGQNDVILKMQFKII